MMSTRLKRLLPYLVLGPVSGPLMAGLVGCVRDRRPWMAAVYAVALVEFFVLLPVWAARLAAT
jgi:hypothetical protein